MKPYTYLIGWTSINQFYYGVRYASGCDPTDLFITYFTSSKRVRELYKELGNPDVIQTRRTFNTPQAAIAWEIKVLRRLCKNNPSVWLNRSVGGAIIFTEDVRKKLSRMKKGRPARNRGVPCSAEQKAKISATRKRKGLGEKSAKYLPRNVGDANPMRNPIVLAAYKKRIIGRKRAYRPDGSWYWSYPENKVAPEGATG